MAGGETHTDISSYRVRSFDLVAPPAAVQDVDLRKRFGKYRPGEALSQFIKDLANDSQHKRCAVTRG